jgi:hypothetical protein
MKKTIITASLFTILLSGNIPVSSSAELSPSELDTIYSYLLKNSEYQKLQDLIYKKNNSMLTSHEELQLKKLEKIAIEKLKLSSRPIINE